MTTPPVSAPDPTGMTTGTVTLPPLLANSDATLDGLLAAVKHRGFAGIGQDSELRRIFNALVERLVVMRMTISKIWKRSFPIISPPDCKGDCS